MNDKDITLQSGKERGTLYIVGTPIGNLSDITIRAKETLSSVDMVLAEDTRVTRKLLDHLDIATELISYHAHSTQKKDDDILVMLREGKRIALVSDAGTPTISDPGGILVEKALSDESINVIPIPGVSALTTALSVSGLPANDFVFLGFLPHKKGRETLISEIAASKRTVVFYESPHRILKALAALEEKLEPKRVVVVARELTKMYESVIRGSAGEVVQFFSEHDDQVRGEFVVVVSGATYTT